MFRYVREIPLQRLGSHAEFLNSLDHLITWILFEFLVLHRWFSVLNAVLFVVAALFSCF